jgi:hypothetical protein
LVDKSAETALDKANDRKQEKFLQKLPPHQGNQSGHEKSKVNLKDLFSPRVRDAVLTTVMGLAAVGLGGVIYQTG